MPNKVNENISGDRSGRGGALHHALMRPDPHGSQTSARSHIHHHIVDQQPNQERMDHANAPTRFSRHLADDGQMMGVAQAGKNEAEDRD